MRRQRFRQYVVKAKAKPLADRALDFELNCFVLAFLMCFHSGSTVAASIRFRRDWAEAVTNIAHMPPSELKGRKSSDHNFYFSDPYFLSI